MIVQVSDGERSSNTSIIIEVIDENDNVPYFKDVDADGYIQWASYNVTYSVDMMIS